MADFTDFLGRFHPLFVHLPIGILLFAFFLEIVVFFYPKKQLKSAIMLALLAGGLSGLFASGMGYFLSLSGAYDTSNLFWHKYLGIGTSLGAFVLYFLKWKSQFNKGIGRFKWSTLLILLLFISLSITGHLGGNLTHGEGYLTEYMPSNLKKIIGIKQETSIVIEELPTQIDSIQVYEQLIQPILKEKCVSCHNQNKKEGELDLTTETGIEQGGRSGHAIEAGKIEKSELIRRISLPKKSKKFMPPNNKTPFSPVEVNILKWWVANGAGFDKKLAAYQPEEKERYLFATYLGIDEEESAFNPWMPQAPALDSAIIKQLQALGVQARWYHEESQLLDVAFTGARNSTSDMRKQQFELLASIHANIYKLDMNDCSLKDQDLSYLSSMENLSFLRIEKNEITEQGITHLEGLDNLEYLNIYANPIGNQALNSLSKMKGLKKVYLWQTLMDEATVAKIPQAVIVF